MDENYVKACAFSTYVGAGIAAFIMVVIGLLSIYFPDPKKTPSESYTGGIVMILFAGGICALAYLGAENACRNPHQYSQRTRNRNYNNNNGYRPGISINF